MGLPVSKDTYKDALAEVDLLLSRFSDADLTKISDSSFMAFVKSYIATLSEAIQQYEEQEYPYTKAISLPDLVEFALNQRNQDKQALADYLDSPHRVEDFWKGTLKLTLEEAQRLHRQLGVPSKVLL